jgi:hypothetical protein
MRPRISLSPPAPRPRREHDATSAICAAGAPPRAAVLHHAGVEVDAGRYRAARAGRPLELGVKEFAVLETW